MKIGVKVDVLIQAKIHRAETGAASGDTWVKKTLVVRPSVYNYDDATKLKYEVEYLTKLQALAIMRRITAEEDKKTPFYIELKEDTLKITIEKFEILESQE